jgi:hypothetical protein
MSIHHSLVRIVSIAAMAVVTAAAATTGLAAQAAAPECSSVAYRGFDSRFQVQLIARVDTADRVTGFEVSNGRPVVAFERRLVAIDGGEQFVLPSIDVIESVAVDADGGLWLQQGARLRRVTREKLETVRTLTTPSRIHNSGHKLFLESESQGSATRLTLRTADDRAALPPFHIDGGTAVAASLNDTGIAAIVGEALLTWTAGARTVTVLRKDRGFRTATDVTLIGPGRVVVSLPHALVLVTERGATILALMKGRARWSGGSLYVLDETIGAIWKLGGVEQVGTAGADKGYAATLIKSMPREASENSRNFLEAARLAGCEGARALKKKR